MSDLFTLTEDCETELLNLIEKYLKELPSDDEPKLYFSGAYDFNRSKFDYGSNTLQFGVLTHNETLALVLLRFLRIIIDHRHELLIEDSFGPFSKLDVKSGFMIETFKIGKQLEISEIIRKISVKEFNFTQIFSLDQSLKTNFNFVGRLDEVDIWTLSRIMKEIKNLY